MRLRNKLSYNKKPIIFIFLPPATLRIGEKSLASIIIETTILHRLYQLRMKETPEKMFVL